MFALQSLNMFILTTVQSSVPTPLVFAFIFFKSISVFCVFNMQLFLKVDVVTLSGEVPVSVCTRRLSENGERWLVMIENVERVSAFLSFSQDVSALYYTIYV